MTKPRFINKKNALIACLVGTIIIGGGFYFYSSSRQQEVHTPGSGTNQETKGSNLGSNTKSPDHTPKKFDTPKDSPDLSSQITGVINFKSVSNGVLTIRTTINQQLTEGTCKLMLTNQSSKKSVSRSAGIVPQPSSSTCKGFDIPTSDLAPGKYTILIKVTSGNLRGSITSSVSI